ncbi:MAG: hypothetical protein ACFE9L_16075 [Candidatus Hodarchaeota archaeon]
MQVTEQFGLRKTLDYLFQLICLSNRLFSTFEFQQGLGFLHIKDVDQYSETNLQFLLLYFLDLIEYFTYEKLLLIQDPVDKSRYSLTGGGI